MGSPGAACAGEAVSYVGRRCSTLRLRSQHCITNILPSPDFLHCFLHAVPSMARGSGALPTRQPGLGGGVWTHHAAGKRSERVLAPFLFAAALSHTWAHLALTFCGSAASTQPDPGHCLSLPLPRAQAAGHIKSLLGLPPDSPACSVQFGSNSHELVVRLLSVLLDIRRQASPDQGSSDADHSSEATSCPGSSAAGRPADTVAGAGATGGAAQVAVTRLPAIRVLASDCEFYSFARQLNRLIGEPRPLCLGMHAAGREAEVERRARLRGEAVLLAACDCLRAAQAPPCQSAL